MARRSSLISVIIVHYNTWDELHKCVSRILESVDCSYEIIIVDNGSEPSDFESSEKVRLIRLGVNIGFGKASNLGVMYAKGDYICFVNSDLFVNNDTLSRLFRRWNDVNERRAVGFLGVLMVDSDKNLIHSYGRSIPASSMENDFLEVDYVTGALLFTSRNIFLQLGGFHDEFFMYYEDRYLQRIARKKGLINCIDITQQIFHMHGNSSKNTSQKIMLKTHGRLIYNKHTMSLLAFTIYRLLSLVKGMRLFFTGEICRSYFRSFLKLYFTLKPPIK